MKSLSKALLVRQAEGLRPLWCGPGASRINLTFKPQEAGSEWKVTNMQGHGDDWEHITVNFVKDGEGEYVQDSVTWLGKGDQKKSVKVWSFTKRGGWGQR